MYELLAIAFGYLCGSIPFGLILAKLGGAGDVRSIGSGNIGATNVLRTGRKGLAALTLLFDALKALVPMIVIFPLVWDAPTRFGGDTMLLAGLAAFVGHCYPVWLGFKGGKGIATFVGVLLVYPVAVIVAFPLVWLGIAFLTRYSSLAALCATVATCIAAFFTTSLFATTILCIMTALTFWRHRANISRLLAGSEGRIGQKE
jgi:glycerol-3-phosphate acyltransferase PlsY